MRIANLSGRLTLIDGDRATDVATASNGRFGPDVQSVYEVFDEFSSWAADVDTTAGESFDPQQLQAPAPWPRQLFAIGLNYREHADESGFVAPDYPVVFTKFASSISGPYTEIRMPEGKVDWEIELVAVIGKRAENVAEADAWSYVAGLTTGQDISERALQLYGPAPQFSLGKSFPGFAPMGPWLVTPDELENRDDLLLTCEIDGEEVQRGRTSAMIFPIPTLIAKLSAVLPLLPGDVIFTGTPAGVGLGREPQRWLRAGEVLTSTIEGIGGLRQTFVSEK